jgi:transcriptional regulator with XRE-family HTH domain
MSILSERLRELRGTSSQSEMATSANMKYQQWARYEKGEVVPGADVLANICRAHSCSADWLLGLNDRNDPTAENHLLQRSILKNFATQRVNSLTKRQR